MLNAETNTHQLEETFARIKLATRLLGTEIIDWLDPPADPNEPLIADRDKLSQLSEVIPDLMPSELTIAVDILLQQEAMNKTVADWLINLTRQAEALVDVVGKGLRLRELLTIIAEDPGY